AIADGNRISVLTVTGDSLQKYVDQPDFDWELKACSRPFDSLNELLAEYSLAGNQGSSASIELVATPVVAIDAKSTVDGDEGTILINLAKSLNPAKCHIGYRAVLHSKTEIRGNILSAELSWSELEHFRQGAGKDLSELSIRIDDLSQRPDLSAEEKASLQDLTITWQKGIRQPQDTSDVGQSAL